MEFILYALLFLPIILATIAFAYWLPNWHADKAVRRYNTVRRFNPDSNGNYPAFFDPESQTVIQFKAGNTPYADNVIIVSGVPNRLEKKSDPQYITVRANWNDRPIIAEPVQEEKPQIEFKEPVQLPEPVWQDVGLTEILRQHKAGGGSKNKAYEIAGISKNGSNRSKEFSDFYDKLGV